MDTAALAEEALGLLGTGRQVAPFTDRHPDLDLPSAYEAAAKLRALREARGERAVGRKIGFTNRTIWDEYGVHAPIWGWVYDSTLHDASGLAGGVPLRNLAEPRLEPEIAFGLSRAPEPGMGPADLAGCVAWMALAFEVVQSPHPGWRFRPADTVVGWGLHGALVLGPNGTLPADPAALSTFACDLLRDGQVKDRGDARNVLGGPLHALAHLADLLSRHGPPLAAGEIVTTGTLTRALPVAPGETWTARLSGLHLPPLTLSFR